MPTEETYELAVELRGEGIDETTDEIEGVEQSFEDTSQTVQDEAGELEGFSQAFEGAMNTIVGGLAVAAAGLASQVPVIGELGGALGAVLDAVAFKMDQVLRPVIGPVADALFDLSGAIFDLEGAWGDLIGIIGSVFSIVGLLEGAFLALDTFLGTSLVGTILGPVWGALQTIGAALASSTGFVLGLAAAVGAAIGAFAVLVLEITGALGKIEDLGAFMGNQLTPALRDLVLVILTPVIGALSALGAAIVGLIRGGLSGMQKELQNVIDIFGGAWSRTLDRAGQLVGDFADTALSKLEGLAGSVIQKFRDLGSRVGPAIDSFINAIQRKLSGALDTLGDLAGRVASTIQSALGDLVSAVRSIDVGQALRDAVDFVQRFDFFGLGMDLVRELADGIEATSRDVLFAINQIAGTVVGEVWDLINDAFQWGEDIADEIADGIRWGMWQIEEAVEDTKDAIMDALGFDLEKNDRMARRWGSDFVEEWARGFEGAAPQLEQQLHAVSPSANIPTSPDTAGGRRGHAFAGRQRIEIPIMLDGTELQRAVTERTRGGFETQGRAPE